MRNTIHHISLLFSIFLFLKKSLLRRWMCAWKESNSKQGLNFYGLRDILGLFIYSHMCASLYYEETRWDTTQRLCSLQQVVEPYSCTVVCFLDCNGLLVGANMSPQACNPISHCTFILVYSFKPHDTNTVLAVFSVHPKT